jgi:hypothetical protein
LLVFFLFVCSLCQNTFGGSKTCQSIYRIGTAAAVAVVRVEIYLIVNHEYQQQQQQQTIRKQTRKIYQIEPYGWRMFRLTPPPTDYKTDKSVRFSFEKRNIEPYAE